MHPWVTERCSPFLPQMGSAHVFAPRDAHKRDDPLAIAPSPALQGPARGLEQVSLSLPIPWHQLGLNFQLLQNKVPGGCTWSWHCATMPECLSSAVSVQGGLWGWQSAVAGFLLLSAGQELLEGSSPQSPECQHTNVSVPTLDPDLLPWSIFPHLLSQGSGVKTLSWQEQGSKLILMSSLPHVPLLGAREVTLGRNLAPLVCYYRIKLPFKAEPVLSGLHTIREHRSFQQLHTLLVIVLAQSQPSPGHSKGDAGGRIQKGASRLFSSHPGKFGRIGKRPLSGELF